MSQKARLYIASMLACASILAVLEVSRGIPAQSEWLTFVIFAILAIIAQFFKAEGPNHSAFFATSVFYFAAVLELSAPLAMLVIALPLLIEWGKARLWDHSDHLRKWYIQPFNIAMHVIAAYAAGKVNDALTWPVIVQSEIATAIGLMIAALVYLMVSQVLLGAALVLARGLSWRESGILKANNLLLELLLLCMGLAVSALWQKNPWLIIPGLAPLVLMYRALLVPKLEEEARTDSKTKLFNPRHFNTLFAEEFNRSLRFDRPLAFIMADLDFLRTINNTYGHLAGDVVIEGIANIIRASTREYDICGRFGGEEFAIVVPEANHEQAVALAERIRQAVENAEFTIATSQTPLRATMSFGVACFPHDADSIVDLIHEADVAVYHAKFLGRNQVISAPDVPQSAKQQFPPRNDTATSTISGTINEVTPVAQPIVEATLERQPAPQATPIAQAIQPIPADDKIGGSSATTPDRRTSPQPMRRDHRISIFVATVIGTALASAFFGLLSIQELAPIALVSLVILAFAAELLQISVYDENSMSVSFAMAVAAALLGGIPGAIALSASIAIADQVWQRRPWNQFYKVLFNWATHLLAMIPLALLPGAFGISISANEIVALLVLVAIGGAIAFAIDSMLISIAISISKNSSVLNTWQTQFRWLGWHYLVLAFVGLFLALAYSTYGVVGVAIFALPAFMLRYSQQQYVLRTQANVHELRRMNTELTRANAEIANANKAIQQMNVELLETMAYVLDARDPFTSGHAAKVADYAVAIAQELQLPEERIQVVRQAALLHDIGKLAIPDRILLKPGRLTSEEYQFIMRHADIGADMLEQSRGLRYLAPFVRHHHERWDGTGYPQQLKGDTIPLEARILAICDTVEAMISDRPYRKGMTFEEMIAELQRCAGSQFEPTLVDLFVGIAQRERESLLINSAQQVNDRVITLSPTLALA